MDVKNSKSLCILMLLAIFIGTKLLYTLQIQPQNEFLGMSAISNRPLTLFSLLLFFSVAVLSLVPKNTGEPSSIFMSCLVLFTLSWFSFFYNISTYVDFYSFLLHAILLFFPVLILLLSREKLKAIFYKIIPVNPVMQIKSMEAYLTIFLCLVSIVLYIKFGSEFKLSFNDSYVRRAYSREHIVGFWSYLLPASLNSIMPLLAFLAGVNRKYGYFFIAFFFATFGFGLIGVKAPIGYAFIMFFLGHVFNFNVRLIPTLLLLSITLIVGLAWIEYSIYNYSVLADLILRRMCFVVPQIQSYYIDYIGNYFDKKELLLGVGDKINISYVIGSHYFNRITTNANTNTFLYELGRHGLLGYSCAVIFLTLFFSFLDYWYEKYGSPLVIGVALIYSLLLVEQSYLTSLVTSGVLIIFLLTLIASKPPGD